MSAASCCPAAASARAGVVTARRRGGGPQYHKSAAAAAGAGSGVPGGARGGAAAAAAAPRVAAGTRARVASMRGPLPSNALLGDQEVRARPTLPKIHNLNSETQNSDTLLCDPPSWLTPRHHGRLGEHRFSVHLTLRWTTLGQHRYTMRLTPVPPRCLGEQR